MLLRNSPDGSCGAELGGVRCSHGRAIGARNGSARPTTFGQLEAALDRLEHETGVDLVAAGGTATTSTLTLPDGTRVTFEGDPAGVAVAVATFLAQRANPV